MARGVNKVILIGNLGKDPEARSTASGTAVTSCSLAVSESWKDKQSGETKEKTEWVNLVFWGRLADIAGQYLKKGSQVYVEGKLQTRKWQDKEGKDRYTTEVNVHDLQMLGGKPGERAERSESRAAPQPAAAVAATEKGFEDDDIPF